MKQKKNIDGTCDQEAPKQVPLLFLPPKAPPPPSSQQVGLHQYHHALSSASASASVTGRKRTHHQHSMYHQPLYYPHQHPYPPPFPPQQRQHPTHNQLYHYHQHPTHHQPLSLSHHPPFPPQQLEHVQKQVYSSIEETYPGQEKNELTYQRLKGTRWENPVGIMRKALKSQKLEHANEMKSQKLEHANELSVKLTEIDAWIAKMKSLTVEHANEMKSDYRNELIDAWIAKTKSLTVEHANEMKSQKLEHRNELNDVKFEMRSKNQAKHAKLTKISVEMDSMRSINHAKLTKISAEFKEKNMASKLLVASMRSDHAAKLTNISVEMDSMRSINHAKLTKISAEFKEKNMASKLLVASMRSDHAAKLTNISVEMDSMRSKYEAAMKVALLACTTDTDRKVFEMEVKRLKQAKRKKTTKELQLGNNDWWNGSSQSTATSKFRQVVELGQTDPGRLTVQSAKTAGFHGIEIVDDLLLEDANQQLLDCTASKCILPIDHPGVQNLMKLIQNTFETGEEKCHSRRVNHANYHAPKGMKETYKAVALLLGDGITIRSVSSFRNKIMALAEKALAETETVATVPAASTAPVPTTTAETETFVCGCDFDFDFDFDFDLDLPELKPRGVESNLGTTNVTAWSSLELMKFLGDHWDTHALSTTFFSFSANNSFVYYKLQNKIVAKLLIPAGFSIVVTTEIHSGLKTLNPYKLKHCSESSDDRLLFRIVHEVPSEGIDMSHRTSEDWLKFATNAIKQIFNQQR